MKVAAGVALGAVAPPPFAPAQPTGTGFLGAGSQQAQTTQGLLDEFSP